MKKRNILCFIIPLFLSGCAGTAAQTQQRGAELVVHYNNVEVYRKNSKYTGEHELRQAVNQEKDVIVIFSADWCSACSLTRKAIDQANLKTKVLYLNIDEKWVKDLAGLMNIKVVPTMIHSNKDGNTEAEKVGPGQIVTYLVSKF
tara:strand:- start:29397 stop:29831 length:435 start_codon:yes stop_codon:yes gene_type:complete